MKNEYADHAIVMLEQVNDRAKHHFNHLTPEQINWKPSEKKWSVAQCLDHLIATNRQYITVFEKVRDQKTEDSFWKKVPFWSKLCGKFMLSGVDPNNKKKIKTFGPFKPRYSTYNPEITNQFQKSQNEVILLIQQIDDVDHSNTIVASPLNNKLVYSLKDAINILWKHSVRHLDQANALVEHPNFPKQ